MLEQTRPLPSNTNRPRGELASLLRDSRETEYQKSSFLSSPFSFERAGSAPPIFFNHSLFGGDLNKSSYPEPSLAPGNSWRKTSAEQQRFAAFGRTSFTLSRSVSPTPWFTLPFDSEPSFMDFQQDMIENQTPPSGRFSIDGSFAYSKNEIIDRRLVLHTPPATMPMGTHPLVEISRPLSTPPAGLTHVLKNFDPLAETAIKQHGVVIKPHVLNLSKEDESEIHFSTINQKHQSSLTLIEGKSLESYVLTELRGRFFEISKDQLGSRFVQKKLGEGHSAIFDMIFEELRPNLPHLMTDIYGNYVAQKLFEYGKERHLRVMLDAISNHVIFLSKHVYGCRVIQHALQFITPLQRIRVFDEMRHHIVNCIKDQNANHVVQRSFDFVPLDKLQFLFDEIEKEIAVLARNPYGCRVIQKMLSIIPDEQKFRITKKLLDSTSSIMCDQFGNYVIQHILEKGLQSQRDIVIQRVNGRLLEFSCQKFASNVVEKCIIYGSEPDRDRLINESLKINEKSGIPNLMTMMKDQFANYVVQRMLEYGNKEQKRRLVEKISPFSGTLKKFAYGKHIAAKIARTMH